MVKSFQERKRLRMNQRPLYAVTQRLVQHLSYLVQDALRCAKCLDARITRNRAKTALAEEAQVQDCKSMLMAAVGLMRLLAEGGQARASWQDVQDDAEIHGLTKLLVVGGVMSRDLMCALEEEEDSSPPDVIRVKVDAVLEHFDGLTRHASMDSHMSSTQDCSQETQVCSAHAVVAFIELLDSALFCAGTQELAHKLLFRKGRECALRLIKVCACECDSIGITHRPLFGRMQE